MGSPQNYLIANRDDHKMGHLAVKQIDELTISGTGVNER